MNKASWLNIVWLLAISLAILIKEVLVPMWKRLSRKLNNKDSHGNKNLKTDPDPINIQRFYQAFLDFKDTQNKWNDKTDAKLEKIFDRLDPALRK